MPVIVLFEPDQVNVRLLARTIKANHFGSVFLIPCAVVNRFGFSEFIVDQASGATGSLLDLSDHASSLHSAYGMKRSVSVPTICLDAYTDYCRGKKVLCKIDVEGGEGKVMEGGKRFFADVKPFIIECFEPDRLHWFETIGFRIEPLQENGNFMLVPNEI